jgi:hypothetical protein
VNFLIKKNIPFGSYSITLCLRIFDWAKYKTTKGAVKMYSLLDIDGNLPDYVNISDEKTTYNKGAYDNPLLKGCVVVAYRFIIIFHF